MSTDRSAPVAIIGAGPTGIEAALACAERDLPFRVFEAGPRVGAGVAEWGHVRLFTPWRMNLSARMTNALGAVGGEMPIGSSCPTGEEFVAQGLEPIAQLRPIGGAISLGTRVRDIAREGLTKDQEIGTTERARRMFRLIVDDGSGERVERASAVIDCTGGRAVPNWSGDGGIPAPGERSLDRLIERDIPDPLNDASWHGLRILLVGAGHSAQTAAQDLADVVRQDPRTHLTWAVRSAEPDWGSPPDDPLPERAALARCADDIAAGVPGVDFRPGVVVDAFSRESDGIRATLRSASGSEDVIVDRVLALTGRVGDHTMYRQLQVHECYATSGPMKLAATLMESGGDCLEQPETGVDALRNPEPDFFIVGAKSYGRNSQYLLPVGYQQVDQVIFAISV